METENEKRGSKGSTGSAAFGGTKGQQHTGSGFSAEAHKTSAGATETGKESKSGLMGKDEVKLRSENGLSTNMFLTALGIVAGGALLYKGAQALTGSGKKAINKKAIIEIKSTLVIKRPKEELYAYWRNLENLPNFMSHIEEINELDNKRSHWVAEIAGGLGHVEWEAEIVRDQENQLIAWRSLPDSEIENSGEVRFHDAGNRKSTIVETTISYRPPLGAAGKLAAKLLNPAFKKVVENDLKQFKKVMESSRNSKRKGSPASRM